jgi:hypothetical protein
MSGACAAKGVVVAVAVGRRWLVQRRRVTEVRGGSAPTRPHRGGVAAWRGGGGWGRYRGVAAACMPCFSGTGVIRGADVSQNKTKQMKCSGLAD